MLTMVGSDDFGTQYTNHYEELSVDTSLVLTTNTAATGIATIAVDGKGENSIIVVPGANACLTEEAAVGSKLLGEKLAECSVFVIHLMNDAMHSRRRPGSQEQRLLPWVMARAFARGLTCSLHSI